MATVIRKNPALFLKELKEYYDDVWKIPGSEYLKEPDFLVVDRRTGKKVKISFVVLDDGETVSVVYDDMS
ncbi:MAG: hypothetical protein J7K48_00975 [Thermococcus sp.]|uniref:Uncharacterized protein n=1 Tax=Thermococcus guaymasensis DSM 11113 TaxID=1432656 RepID=A0A0X1KIX4_9EURY|nr:hypothetical protein [Thermococcus guaymasensis]AJC71205.1 hypothetical protein X802_02705 [Thermococcus guaymasensis DSM 11113]MCD6523566.1 hypothetical protein [Thermococcus sp.]